MKVIKVSDEAYGILKKIAEETNQSIACIASKLIIEKDKELYFETKIIKNLSSR